MALKPFLIAQADYGILVSAHQQNTVLALEGGYPAGMWFRDCQGTTFRAETISCAGCPMCPALPGRQRAEPSTSR